MPYNDDSTKPWTTRPETRRQYAPHEIIERLAALHGITHDDGRVNYSAFSRRTGIPTASVSRMHRGARSGSGDRRGHWIMSSETVQKLMSAFHLSYAEASGQSPIPEPGEERKRGSARYEPTTADLELLRDLRALSPASQAEVRALVTIKSQLEQSGCRGQEP